MLAAYTEIRLGDQVRMRKPHPCGSSEWEVVRLGADIGIRCNGCARRVLLPRSQFMRQVKSLLKQGPVPDAGPGSVPGEMPA
ncbi:MAG: DUF951 domain-containing protein [Anaerolineae bacterium]|jgi:hypothetical protein|nr:DUF951 domain-containing protein [Anaerolineae bacterium]